MKKKIPSLIPIFPLSGVIFFPKTNLPLNIFEPKYLDLVNDTMDGNKFMGMIQSKKNKNDLYGIGCLGKISDLKKSEDGRLIINLTGISRFEIKKEIKNEKQYREFEISYEMFEGDLDQKNDNSLDSEQLTYFIAKTKKFFEKNGLILNWNEFKKLNQDQQVNTLAMIAPVTNEEKQKLLETVTVKNKTQVLLDIIKFYTYENNLDSSKTVN
jgi:Lon protease-like protein|tara:strand:- start:298 stop:933 length:636 start_codon:yes stop_codon:yes gene_type:complete